MLIDFYLENLTQHNVMQLPVTPENYEVRSDTDIETVRLTVHGDINIPTFNKPKSISISGIFSTNKTNYLNKNWMPDLIHCTVDYVNVINSWKNKKDVIRVLIVPRGTIESRLDSKFYISGLKITGESEVTGDIDYTIYFSEYTQLNSASTSSSTNLKRPVSGAKATTSKTRTYTVKKGDSLWAIARKFYGDGNQEIKIINANKSKIKNKNLIYPGQTFIIP